MRRNKGERASVTFQLGNGDLLAACKNLIQIALVDKGVSKRTHGSKTITAVSKTNNFVDLSLCQAMDYQPFSDPASFFARGNYYSFSL